MRKINFNEWSEKVPDYTLEALQRYFEYGLPPGSFLSSVLRNDLMGALTTADEYNKEALADICSLIHWEFPTTIYGSEYNMLAHMSQKLSEREKANAEENNHE